jgi:hypothetical protein
MGRVALSRHLAGCVSGHGADQRRVRAPAVPALLPASGARSGSPHHRLRVRGVGGRGLHLRHGAAAGAASLVSSRLHHRLRHQLWRLPHLPHRSGGRDRASSRLRARAHPVRRAGPSGGGQPAHGARPRHQRGLGVCDLVRARQRACGSWRCARHRHGRPRSRLRLPLPRLHADRGGRRGPRFRGRVLCRRGASGHQRHRLQVFHPAVRELPGLRPDGDALVLPAPRLFGRR